ncbi:MAG: hypothetical protein JW800_02600, partial [Candidatus Omnitrophica bacterium]|nr:hypothetical protein [Candidatus Omnitrophota bacterium]
MGGIGTLMPDYIRRTAVTIFMIGCMLQSSVTFADIRAEMLNDARLLVQKKEYEKALEIYSEIGYYLKRDPGLVIEWARVLAYAGKHKEAIELLEDVLLKHPERERDLIADLAEQYKWDGQYGKAVEAYKKALEY